MLKCTVLVAAAALAATSALAAAPAHVPADPHEPIPGKEDPTLRTFPYDPAETMRLTSPGVVPMRIIFTDGSVPITEGGELVSVNPKDAPDWYASVAGNSLILQPRHLMPPSILFVTTKRAEGAGTDNYVIELVVGTPDKDVYYQVSYTYPGQAAAAAADARAKAMRIRTESKIRTSLTQARFNAPRQWHYSKMGADCATMVPTGWNWISDDGHQTTLLFPPHMAGAEIYSRESDDDKDESLITPIPTTTAVGTLDVLPSVYRQLVLRLGSKVCALRADHYDPIGTQPGGGSGTISADVIRIRNTK